MSGGGPGSGADPPWADEGADGRRRRAVLAGHRGERREAAALAGDADPSVRAAALGALGRLGALDESILLGAFGDPDPGVRRRAVALAGGAVDLYSASAEMTAGVAALLDDADPSVVEMAAWALGEWGPGCGEGATAGLCRLAVGHDSPLCREAAVAALGALGASGTLAVILGALDDTVNIRRRAVVALAAFDDPGAEEGLRRCLGDRDWQVRQAAQELLGDHD